MLVRQSLKNSPVKYRYSSPKSFLQKGQHNPRLRFSHLTMATFNNKLDASSYQHPGRDGPFQPLREKAMQSMVAAGIDYEYLAESPVAWAEDQDPFGHVTSQVYTHYAARAFNRMLDSWSIILGDKFAALEGASGVGVITNQYSVKIKRVVKYPDTVSYFALKLSEV